MSNERDCPACESPNVHIFIENTDTDDELIECEDCNFVFPWDEGDE